MVIGAQHFQAFRPCRRLGTVACGQGCPVRCVRQRTHRTSEARLGPRSGTRSLQPRSGLAFLVPPRTVLHLRGCWNGV